MLRSRSVPSRKSSSNASIMKKPKVKNKKDSSWMLLFTGVTAVVSLLIYGIHQGKYFTSHSTKLRSYLRKNSSAQDLNSENLQKSIYSLTVKDVHGLDFPLTQYNGFVSLVVNVASE